MIRIPFNVVTTFDMPPMAFTDADLDYLNNFHIIHQHELEYRWYRYPSANKISYHSATTPINMDCPDDFLSIDNFWQLLPGTIKNKFSEYFTDEFFPVVNNPEMRSVRLYLNNPGTAGIHVHKDIYSGGGIPRQLAISLPVSPNSLTSDLVLYDDELNLVEKVRYKKNVPTALNTTVFHEVVHNDHTDIRKIVTMSPNMTMEDFLVMYKQGRVVR